jgi:hypothetical protein
MAILDPCLLQLNDFLCQPLARRKERMSLKQAAARLVGLSPSDIFFLKSLRHSWWLPQMLRLPLARLEYASLSPVDDEDRDLSRRIIDYYDRASLEDRSVRRSAMWDRNLAGPQAPLIELLLRKDIAGLASLLKSFLRTQVVRGIDAGDSYTGRNWRIHSLKLLDNLVSLAEQVGAARAESSQGKSMTALGQGLEPLVAAIEQRLGAPLGVPDVGGPYGLRVGGRLITLNSPEYARIAWRLREATRGLQPLQVLEIGAGYGAMARYFLQLADVESYTILDLPEIACLHAYYLGKSFGQDAVWLHGEPGDARIRIIPPQALSDLKGASVVFNQDSLPEIPSDAATVYLTWIRDHLSGIFFSCNHETLVPGCAVTTVPDLVSQVGGLERVRRDLCWSRPGYVEEVYRPL